MPAVTAEFSPVMYATSFPKCFFMSSCLGAGNLGAGAGFSATGSRRCLGRFLGGVGGVSCSISGSLGGVLEVSRRCLAGVSEVSCSKGVSEEDLRELSVSVRVDQLHGLLLDLIPVHLWGRVGKGGEGWGRGKGGEGWGRVGKGGEGCPRSPCPSPRARAVMKPCFSAAVRVMKMNPVMPIAA